MDTYGVDTVVHRSEFHHFGQDNHRPDLNPLIYVAAIPAIYR